MPFPMWRVGPCCSSAIWFTPRGQCPLCRRPGVFDGWRLTMYEAMARYQYVYRLKPIGPHRPFADQLLTPFRQVCGRCGGIGVLTVHGGLGWRQCPDCEGTGGVWAGRGEDVNAAYLRVLQAFPGATAMEAPAAFLSGAIAFDEANGLMVATRAERPVQGASATKSRAAVAPAGCPVQRKPPPPPLPHDTQASASPGHASWIRWSWLAVVVLRALMIAAGS
jgi:hypothetical protein